MIKVAGSIPSQSPPVANGFHPAPSVSAPGHAPAMVFTNPVATAELPEVNEPEKPHSDGEAMLGHSSAPSIGHSRVSFAIVSK